MNPFQQRFEALFSFLPPLSYPTLGCYLSRVPFVEPEAKKETIQKSGKDRAQPKSLGSGRAGLVGSPGGQAWHKSS
jgi:hypothetical protein